MKRVVITGLGIICPLGVGIKEYWQEVIKNKSGLSALEEYDTFNFKSKSFGYTRQFDPVLSGLSATQIRRMDRISQFGMVCANEAIQDSGIEWSSINYERVGVNIANAVAGTKFMDEEFLVLTNNGTNKVLPKDASPYSYLKSMPNTTSNEVAMQYGLQGECLTTATGCTAGIDSLGYAFDMIRLGELDIVIAGAAEAPITPVTIAAFEVINTLSTNNDPPERASRPFDKTRNGFVLGEGSGIFIIEELEHAKKRGAKIYAEIMGFASMNNAIHMTGLHPEGQEIAQSIEMVLNEAKVNRDNIDYISAHGSGTVQNDTSETSAYKRVFGKHAYNIPISSLKSIVGHSLGAATAVELVTCCLGMKYNYITPTLNYSEKDENCDLDYVPNKGREKKLNLVLKNASGFSGIHSSILLRNFNN